LNPDPRLSLSFASLTEREPEIEVAISFVPLVKKNYTLIEHSPTVSNDQGNQMMKMNITGLKMAIYKRGRGTEHWTT